MLLAQQRFRIADPVADVGFTSLQAAYAGFLSRYSWDWFCTFTFRCATHPEAARKYFGLWVSLLNRHLFGTNWYRKGKSVFWVLAYERHQSGALHMHALVSHPVSDLNYRARRLEFMDLWNGLGKADVRSPLGRLISSAKGPGFARIAAADNRCAVSAYVSKYVTKGGEIELGGSIGQEFVS